MNFKDQIQQIFGTTDIYELKQISRDADNYRCLKADMNNSSISEKKKNTGRKNSFTEEQLAHILALQNRGEKITDIARQYHVSRQTIYSQIKRAYNFSDDPDVKMRMNFMNHDDLCTTIDIDFKHEKINHTFKIQPVFNRNDSFHSHPCTYLHCLRQNLCSSKTAARRSQRT